MPHAVPGMAATGLDLARWLWDKKIPAFCYSTVLTDLELHVAVGTKLGCAEERANRLAGEIADRLTGQCLRVIVPADRYKTVAGSGL